jgi:hypothetical protein
LSDEACSWEETRSVPRSVKEVTSVTSFTFLVLHSVTSVSVPNPPPHGMSRCTCIKCVFITAVPITKLFAWGGGGGQWRTCAKRDYEPKPVWTSLLVACYSIAGISFLKTPMKWHLCVPGLSACLAESFQTRTPGTCSAQNLWQSLCKSKASSIKMRALGF